jgi:hypothetical protein
MTMPGSPTCGKCYRELREREYCQCEWTTTPPTAPGWYWAKHPSGWSDDVGCTDEDAPVVVFLMDSPYSPGGLVVDAPGHLSKVRSIEEFTHWLGPIEPPEPPLARAHPEVDRKPT